MRCAAAAVMASLWIGGCTPAPQPAPAATQPSAASATPADIQTSIRELEQRQVVAALAGDRAALEEIFAPQFRMVSPVGAMATREELLGILTSGNPPYRAARYDTETLDIYGDVVVTTGTESVEHGAGTQEGLKQQRRVTQVWQRNGAGWWLVLRQATLIAAPAG